MVIFPYFIIPTALNEERSNSFTGSINYDKAIQNTSLPVFFTLEGVLYPLKMMPIIFSLGQDEFGQRFGKEKRSWCKRRGY